MILAPNNSLLSAAQKFRSGPQAVLRNQIPEYVRLLNNVSFAIWVKLLSKLTSYIWK